LWRADGVEGRRAGITRGGNIEYRTPKETIGASKEYRMVKYMWAGFLAGEKKERAGNIMLTALH